MSENDLQNVDDKFMDAQKIGEGTYGVVFKVRERHSGELKALKQIRLGEYGFHNFHFTFFSKIVFR